MHIFLKSDLSNYFFISLFFCISFMYVGNSSVYNLLGFRSIYLFLNFIFIYRRYIYSAFYFTNLPRNMSNNKKKNCLLLFSHKHELHELSAHTVVSRPEGCESHPGPSFVLPCVCVCVWAGTGRSDKGVCMIMMRKTTMSLSSLTCSSSVKLNKADTANTGQRRSKVERHNADQTDI